MLLCSPHDLGFGFLHLGFGFLLSTIQTLIFLSHVMSRFFTVLTGMKRDKNSYVIFLKEMDASAIWSLHCSFLICEVWKTFTPEGCAEDLTRTYVKYLTHCRYWNIGLPLFAIKQSINHLIFHVCISRLPLTHLMQLDICQTLRPSQYC